MTKPLSPAAQAVLDGFRAVPTLMDGPSIAGALRAAADQVVPETTTPWNSTLTPMISAGEVRAKFLAIAAELEGGNA
jgi:hypothetical protein